MEDNAVKTQTEQESYASSAPTSTVDRAVARTVGEGVHTAGTANTAVLDAGGTVGYTSEPGKAGAARSTTTMRFLIVEDNPKLGSHLRKVLEEQGYIVDLKESGREGEEMAVLNTYDCIILDIMLPDHDGVQICRNLRRRKVSTPILMLTGLSGMPEKVTGLEAGADDYLTKPFDLEELVARVRALLRRARADEGMRLHYADIEMDLAKRSVSRAGKPISLTAKEFALLEYFLRNPNRVQTRTLIGERVWDIAFADDSNVIEVYVSRLRNKIDKGFDKQLLHTVIGTGYLLSADGPPA